jgi:membrane associated rhomboid family serine protease
MPSPGEAERYSALLFRGPRGLCQEYSLVLESKSIEHEVLPSADGYSVFVPPTRLAQAYEELSRYSAEREVRQRPAALRLFAGTLYGAAGYALVLLIVAYLAGRQVFHLDWFAAGALDSSLSAKGQWWRAVTALSLHRDPEHLLGNLLAGTVAGAAAGRLIGPGLAWSGGLAAAIMANLLEMAVSPPTHRAIGASTLVFALLGLITGLASVDSLTLRQRFWHRWSPVVAGIGLLAIFGSGGADPSQGVLPTTVDVLGHLLGFLMGIAGGWGIARLGLMHRARHAVQIVLGASALLVVSLAWLLALSGA